MQPLPQGCVLCGGRVSGDRLCAGCRADLPRAGPHGCPVCALPTPDGETCGACLKRPPAFSRTVTAFHYAFPADALLQAFKYGGKLALAPLLAAPLAEAAAAVPAPDLLIPMPLHPRRLRERGFNQALEIAKWVAREVTLPLDADGCRRTLDTQAQAGLDWRQRKRNVRGAFACQREMDGLRVAVVDDVMTTGATLAELARVLRRAGAAEVQAWVVARTRPE